MTIFLLENLGPKLRNLRNREGFTLKEISDKSGVTVADLSIVERGEREPTPKTLKRILRAINPAYDLVYCLVDKDDKIFAQL